MKLEDLADLEKAATPGPWRAFAPVNPTSHRWDRHAALTEVPYVNIDGTIAFREHDAVFIAASRGIVPKLLNIAIVAQSCMNVWKNGLEVEANSALHHCMKAAFKELEQA